MVRYAFFLAMFISEETFPQVDRRNLLGIYRSESNTDDRISELEIKINFRFVYRYKMGECKGEVHGSWSKQNDQMKLKNDTKYKNPEGSFEFPDMGLVPWDIEKKGLRPDEPFYACGFLEKSVHKKSKD